MPLEIHAIVAEKDRDDNAMPIGVGYISFVVSKGAGDTQSVFDDFRLEEMP
jgi:hypothetical protein